MKFPNTSLIITIIILVLSTTRGYSQNPEEKIFWSVSINGLMKDVNDGEFKSEMGWSDTPTGKFGFKFSKDSVIFYEDGWMGKNYKIINRYVVIKRAMLSSDDKGGVYGYQCEKDGVGVNFLVKSFYLDGGSLALTVRMYIGEQKVFSSDGSSKRSYTEAIDYRCITGTDF